MHITRLLIVSAAFAASLVVRADSAGAAPATSPSGVIGLRYGEISSGAIDPLGSSRYGLSGGLTFNVPVHSSLDLGLAYDYRRLTLDHTTPFSVKDRDHVLFATAKAYTTWGTLKPFAAAGIGYEWNRRPIELAGTRLGDGCDEQALWRLATGVEISTGPITLTPRIAFTDGFRDSNRHLTYDVEASTWLTKRIGAFADIAYTDPQHDPVSTVPSTSGSTVLVHNGGAPEAWGYRVGLRVRL